MVILQLHATHQLNKWNTNTIRKRRFIRSLLNTRHTKKYSRKKLVNDSLKADHGITRLNFAEILDQKEEKYIPCHQNSRMHSTNGLKNISKKATSVDLNHRKHHPSSLLKRKKQENSTPVKIIDICEFTKLNAYPLPLISDLMIKLKGSEYFTKLDIRWGYNNVQIKESDRWKATFITNRGLFETNAMFFGLRNSPATFQAMMDDYFRDLTETGHVIIYMDDILIHAHTKVELKI